MLDPHLLNSAIAHHGRGEVAEAARLCELHLKNAPQDIRALHLHAALLMAQKKLQPAANVFNQIMTFDAKNTDALLGLGKVRAELGRIRGAAQAYYRALKINPTLAQAQNGLGALYQQLGKLEKALPFYLASAALNPNELVFSNIGHVYKGLGDFEKSADAFHAALKINPQFSKAYQSLASLKQYKFTQSDIKAMQGLLDTAILSGSEKSAVHFALGKACEEHGIFDIAFKHFTEANKLTRKALNYSPERIEQLTKHIINTLNADLLREHIAAGCVSRAPIFIVSMPRAGSTLVEQILASHPLVHGGNELPDIQHTLAASKEFTKQGGDVLSNLKLLTDTDFTALGDLYLERINKRYQSPKPYFTDKMPFNFQLLEFIQLILPSAKIIHVKRNALDTCMGCFKLPFNEHHDFSYDLKELGHYYTQYERLMQHWQSVMPDKIYTLHYEELVADQEAQTRALLNFCELPWNENCLTFYKTKRAVITESAGQVRQPIYKTAVNAWQPYANYLQPLFSALQIDIDGVVNENLRT